MFRSIFDHPQGDIFSFTSVTKDKIIWFVVACLLYLLCFVLMLLRALPSLVVAVQQQPDSFPPFPILHFTWPHSTSLASFTSLHFATLHIR